MHHHHHQGPPPPPAQQQPRRGARSDSWLFFDDPPQDDDDNDPSSAASFAFPSQPHFDANSSRHFAASSSSFSSDNNNTVAHTILCALSPTERAALPAQLNAMQLELLPYCLGSDQSVVVGAPTGGGKTCLLDMAILRSVLCNDSSTQIYYIAPSRALCRLQALGFSHRFRNLNLSVDVVTGDEDGGAGGGNEDDEGDGDDTGGGTYSNLPVNMTAAAPSHKPSALSSNGKHAHRLIVCTPEKLEAETRRCTDARLVGGAHHRVLLLVDEVHHVGEAGRGAVLELVLTRFLWAFRNNQHALRFVCVSATIPNIAHVASWLGGGRHFEFTQRPVPLTVRVLGYPKSDNKSDYLFEQDLDRHVPDVLRQFGVGKPALVFVSSRKGAKDLAGKLRQAGLGTRTPSSSVAKTDDDALSDYLRWGIGFHSAGLSSNDRAVVENLFRQGQLLVVCCTSTLAVGVDLPANLCLIRSTRAYRGPALGFQDLERATMIQMIGRAGRPGYDTEGTAVIMTSRGEESKFTDLSQGLLAVESQLVGNALLEAVNAEIVRGRLTSTADCEQWWGMTFAGQHAPWNGQEVLGSLFALECARATTADTSSAAGGSSSSSARVESTATGRVACTHHVRLETIARFAALCQPEAVATAADPEDEGASAAPVKWDLHAITKAVCDGAEFAELLPRRDQKKFLNSVAWTLGRFKSAKSVRVGDGADAAFQLLQAVMGGVALPDHNLRQNAKLVFERAPRLCRALLKMLVDVRSNKALVCSLLSKCLQQKCWEYDQVGQLSGVGVKTKEKLQLQGVTRLSDVVSGRAGVTGLPAKAVLHARALLAQKRLPQVAFVDNALVVSLSGSSSSSASSKNKPGVRASSSGWWLTCLGGPGNKLLGWSETADRLVIPHQRQSVTRIMVFAIHQDSLGMDTRLIAQVDSAARQVHVESLESDFWDGFFLAEPKVTPVKKPRAKKEKVTPPVAASAAAAAASSSVQPFKDKIAQYYVQPQAAAAAAPRVAVPAPRAVNAPFPKSAATAMAPLPPPQRQQVAASGYQSPPPAQQQQQQQRYQGPPPPAQQQQYQPQQQQYHQPPPPPQQQPQRYQGPPPVQQQQYHQPAPPQQPHPQRYQGSPPVQQQQQQQRYQGPPVAMAAPIQQQQQPNPHLAPPPPPVYNYHPTAYHPPPTTVATSYGKPPPPPPPPTAKFEDIFFL